MNEDFEKKCQEFLKEYGELVKKYNIDLATYPMFVPDGEGSFKIIIQSTPVDTSKLPVKSPLIS